MASEPQKNNGGAADDLGVSHAHVGPILGILVIVLVLILGGLYLWGAMLSKQATPALERVIPNNEPETTRANTDRQIMDTTSSSNDLDAIYADLESTNLNDLDTDLTQIEAEMNGSLR
jgi:hypothetical protein